MKTTGTILNTLLAVACVLGVAGACGQNLLQPPATVRSSSTGVSVSSVNGQSVVTVNGREVFSGPTQGAVSSRSCNVNGVEYSAVFDGDKVIWENTPGAASQLQTQSGGAGANLSQFTEQHRQMVERMMETQRHFMQGHGGIVGSTNFSMSGGSSGGGSSVQSSVSTSINSSTQAGSSGSPSLSGQASPIAVSPGSDAAITIKSVNGSTVVVYQGQEFSVGPTKGNVSAKSKNVQGDNFAAAFEGDRVIWENSPGAALKVK